MSAHPITLDDLPRDGERLELSKVSKLNGFLFMLGAGGLLVSACYMFGVLGEQCQKEFAYSWLFAFFFFFTITNGGIFWTMLQHLSNSAWSVTVRRFFENLAGNIRWMAVFALPLIFFPPFKHALWEWITLHEEAAKHGGTALEGLHHMSEADPHVHILVQKYGYLNIPFWTLRAVLYFVFLGGMATLLRKWSIQQDTDGDFKHTFRSRALCAFPMLFYALAVTFSAVDWIMSMDFTWFSTMWGVYIFAGGAWASMAVSILALIHIRSHGYLKKQVNPDHFHIMGQLLFAFTVFWAYIAFSQFFLIWYANITEETRFYILRNTGHWHTLSNILVWGHFVITFVLLLSASRKKRPEAMVWVCAWILVMHAVDLYWLIIPERAPSLSGGTELWYANAWIGDIAAFVGIGGIVGWAYLRRLSKASLYPCRDPRLLESVEVVNIV
jgi:hypothetical protein